MSGLNSRKKLYLRDIPSLNQAHCKIKDPERVERLINEFIRAGVDKLQVVTDYDCTLTKQRLEDGRKVTSTLDSLKACESISSSFVEEYNKLQSKYNPISFDVRIPVEEKKKAMTEWWGKMGQLLVGFPLKQKEIDDVAFMCKDQLRDHTYELFETLHRLNVAVLIFSAGLGNILLSVLKQSKIMFPNVKVVSNFLKYKGDLLDGFQEPIIHSFNKDEFALDGSEYYDLVQNRDHIIVMGDSIGDAGMADRVPISSHIIKIGFLYDQIEKNLQKYMDVFDIVLVDDQTMDVPIALLKCIEES